MAVCACVFMDRDEVEAHARKKKTNPISSHVNWTSLINQGFIIWKKNTMPGTACKPGMDKPTRVVNHNTGRIGFTLPARGTSHFWMAWALMSSHRPCKNVDFLNPRRRKCIQISSDSESCCALSILYWLHVAYANETNIVKCSLTISWIFALFRTCCVPEIHYYYRSQLVLSCRNVSLQLCKVRSVLGIN